MDLHEFVVGEEVGSGGFRHFQFAVHTAGDLREYCDKNILGWHIEDAVSWEKSKMYCRKGHRVHEYSDNLEFREYTRIKSRPYTPIQLAIDRSLRDQGDRCITCWVDRKGGHGKSTWSYLNARNGRIFTVPRAEQSAARVIDYIAMHYDGEEIITFDIPRAKSLSTALAETLEEIKDGDICSAKYQGSKRFIKGVKVLVTTNKPINYTTYCALSKDRWDIWEINEIGDVYRPEPPKRTTKKKKGDNSEISTR